MMWWRATRMACTAAAAAIVLLLLVPSVSASCGPSQYDDTNDVVALYLESDGPGGAFLSMDPDAGKADQHTPSVPNQAVQYPSIATGGEPGYEEFVLSSGLPDDVYLNLSKRVFGEVYWQSDQSQLYAKEMLKIQVALYAGDRLVGGEAMVYDWLDNVKTTWVTFHFCFPAEVRKIDAGEPLSLRVTPSGQMTDVRIGTGGDHQSDLVMHVFPSDPLQSGIYVEENKIQFGQTAGRSGGNGTDERGQTPVQPTLSALGLPLLGLLAWRRRPRTALIALALVAVALAGCAKGGSDEPVLGEDTDTPKSGVTQTTQEEDTSLGETGAISGFVGDGARGGVAVGRAQVALLGTNHFIKTGHDGTFRFDGLVAGTYFLRVDKAGFESVEESVPVEAGKRTNVDVVLFPPGASNTTTDLTAHAHDLWRGQEATELWSGTIFPSFSNPQSGVASETLDTWICDSNGWCHMPLPVPTEKIVLPGTVMVQAEVEYEGNALLGLVATPPGADDLPFGMSNDAIYLPRASGVPTEAHFFPDVADSGHAKLSEWEFALRTEGGNALAPMATQAYHSAGAIDVRLTIHKGVVPLEPAHPDFWGNRTEIPLFDNEERSSGQLACDDCFPGNIRWHVGGEDGFVPPDTAEIRGTLTWAGPGGAPVSIPEHWGVSYQPADVPFDRVGPWFLAEMDNVTGEMKAHFVIRPTGDEVDQWYQRSSNWQFSIDDYSPQDGMPDANTGLITARWWLTATAYKAT